jgi:hypothetical protein
MIPRRKGSTEMDWSRKWQELMRRFHRPRRVRKSQQQKILIGLHRQLINIIRGSRIYENRSHQPLHRHSRIK